MALAERIPSLRALSEERRRFQRVRVNLMGRYMLADRREFPCQVVNMSPGGMALIAPVAGAPGERIIACVDHLGLLEGHVARIFQNGFAMTILATPRKRDKLAAQLTWLANRHILGLPEDRRRDRIVPRNPVARLIMPNGVNVTCRIIDVSQSGAGIATDQRPPLGVLVTLGKVQGRVVRHLDDGFAIEFTRLQHPDFLEDNVTGG
jgi:PilZ domain